MSILLRVHALRRNFATPSGGLLCFLFVWHGSLSYTQCCAPRVMRGRELPGWDVAIRDLRSLPQKKAPLLEERGFDWNWNRQATRLNAVDTPTIASSNPAAQTIAAPVGKSN